MRVLNGKVAVITGAASGIGQALAIQLADEGCRLALADIDSAQLYDCAEKLRHKGATVSAHTLDVADRAAVYALAEQVVHEHGGADLIINNAGVAVSQTVSDLSYDDFEWLMNINFWGVVHGSKAFLPRLLKQGSGHIVNVSSIFGIISQPTQAAYNASKFAVRGFTEALRQEVCARGVTVSCVHPGGVRTNIARAARFYRGIDGGQDAARAARNFDRLARTSSERAARIILDGIKRDQPRILVGADARLLDHLQRLMPASYPKLVARLMRRKEPEAGDNF